MKAVFNIFLSWALLFLIILFVFNSWFSFKTISSGDAPFYFKENAIKLPYIPHVWETWGLGQYNPQLFSFPYLLLPVKILSLVGLDWAFIERLVWYFPFLIVSIFSSIVFANTIIPKVKFKFLTIFIFLLNTYILMIIDGGQISIALSYAIFPLTIALFFKNIINPALRWQIFSGLIFALHISFEPRIAMLALVTVIFFAFCKYRLFLSKYLKVLFIPLIITVGAHFYWILPLVITKKEAYISSRSSADWLSFLSFSHFSDSISLLHPNWPENIFGKTYFMRPEFLLIPFVAFCSLLFAKNKKIIIFFATIGLIGAFLAKGINPPFGEIYKILFTIPGFNLFRDPTKFYVLVALSYSILIPFGINEISLWIKSKLKNSKIAYLPFLLFTFYFLLLIKPALFHNLSGTLKSRIVPEEYIMLKNFISSQPEFFRTFWIPSWHRFGYFDSTHPVISSDYYFRTNDPLKIVELLGKKGNIEELRFLGIKYIIIPYDFEGNLFLKERKYDHKKREKTEKTIEEIGYLKKHKSFSKISVFELLNPRGLFWLESESGKVSYRFINPTKYEVTVKNKKINDYLVFSQAFDPFWTLKIEGENIKPEELRKINKFLIAKKGEWRGALEYTPQKYVYLGMFVSLTTFLATMFFLLKPHGLKAVDSLCQVASIHRSRK